MTEGILALWRLSKLAAMVFAFCFLWRLNLHLTDSPNEPTVRHAAVSAGTGGAENELRERIEPAGGKLQR
ncbi:hypothetical protein FDG94_gp080 [Pseudomonas phage SM1]|uniref:Uncharacterized protein n=1 Tax=Pseudomonas phage SM1 TaxID=1772332 RepID=A0A0U3E4P3_9CAUD|nr:hypothetical protein FDG94_gp080 [Pseudomonas phage SM1]ALT58072.1 hypothetical protein SM1_080 [Pseudomonas phage SM1]